MSPALGSFAECKDSKAWSPLCQWAPPPFQELFPQVWATPAPPDPDTALDWAQLRPVSQTVVPPPGTALPRDFSAGQGRSGGLALKNESREAKTETSESTALPGKAGTSEATALHGNAEAEGLDEIVSGTVGLQEARSTCSV